MPASKPYRTFGIIGPPPGFSNPWPSTIRDKDYSTILSNQYYQWSGIADWFTLDNYSTPGGTLDNVKIMPAPLVGTQLYDGVNCNMFFCNSLGRSSPGLQLNCTYFTKGMWALVYKFTDLDAAVLTEDFSAPGYSGAGYRIRYNSPFGIVRYGHNDSTEKASNIVPLGLPSPLPTWTFARTGGHILSTVQAGSVPSDADSTTHLHQAENGSAQTGQSAETGHLAYRDAESFWWGGIPLTFNVGSMGHQYLESFGAGTSRGIDPTWYQYLGATYPGTPKIGFWKTAVAMGLQPTVGNTLTHDFGIYLSDPNYRGTTFIMDASTCIYNNQFTAAAGTALLIFAFNTAWSKYSDE